MWKLEYQGAMKPRFAKTATVIKSTEHLFCARYRPALDMSLHCLCQVPRGMGEPLSPPRGNAGSQQLRNQPREGGGASLTPDLVLPAQAELDGAHSANAPRPGSTGAGGGEAPGETRTFLTTRS